MSFFSQKDIMDFPLSYHTIKTAFFTEWWKSIHNRLFYDHKKLPQLSGKSAFSDAIMTLRFHWR